MGEKLIKPIIALSLSGLFVDSYPWEQAHLLWFEWAAEELQDSSIIEYRKKEKYLLNVKIIMKKLFPNIPDKERLIIAREKFADIVCDIIKVNNHKKDYVNHEVIDYFRSLKNKDKCRLALITTNLSTKIEKILSILSLHDLFDIIEASHPDEDDDKAVVFDRFLEKYEEPALYVGSSRKSSFEYCKQKGIAGVYFNTQSSGTIDGVETVHSLEELKDVINNRLS